MFIVVVPDFRLYSARVVMGIVIFKFTPMLNLYLI